MDDVLCAYTVAHAEALRGAPDVPFPQGTLGFFSSLMPIDGAIAAIDELRRLHDIYILTAPSTRNAHSYTEKRLWVEQYFGYDFTKRLILSPDKGLLRGDCLIDDQISGKGQERFQGMLIHFGSQRFPDWDAILTFLRESDISWPSAKPID